MKIGRRRRNIILSVVLCVILAVWMVWGNKALMVSTISIPSSHIPAAFSGFRIAQVSDLHNVVMHMAANSGCRLSVDWLLPIRGCFPNMMPDYIQTEAQAW